MGDESARIVVSGVVQGVGFRWFTLKRARAIGVRGTVCNLSNGDVEIEVEGTRESIEQLIDAVREGPRGAQVSEVLVEWNKPVKGYRDFIID
jgi:acylphosphatase